MGLASISNEAENQMIADMLDGGRGWIGGHDTGSEGEWVWTFGNGWTYANWNWGEPNDVGLHGEDCLEMNNGRWNDMPCDWTGMRAYVCQRVLGSNEEPEISIIEIEPT